MARVMQYLGFTFKNLFKQPVTTKYPAVPAVYPENARGHIEIDMESCISCSLCAKSCPTRSIVVNREEKTWSIDRFDCLACGYCVTVCPKKCLKVVPGYQTPGTEKYTDLFRKQGE